MQAKEIEPELKRLINITSSIEPGLAKRLDELRRWIKDKKPGLLTSKKFVMDFLLELILDVEIWLELQQLTEQEKQDVFAQMTPTERYWYEFLFPQWFNLFASFNPADKIKIIPLLTNEILWQSNHLPNGCYAQCSIQP